MPLTKEHLHIPIMQESSEPSERMERIVRNELAKSIKSGKGKFKIRTASGAFNEFIINKKKQHHAVK